MTHRECVAAGTALLEKAQVPEAALDALELYLYVTGMSRAYYLMYREDAAPQTAADRYAQLIELRASRVPLQHITGEQEFYGRAFHVSGDVLIPRQDTEVLVETVLQDVRRGVFGSESRAAATEIPQGRAAEDAPAESPLRILDLCTGSGCIAVTLALETGANVTASDLSPAALRVAHGNASGLGARVTFLEGDLWDALPEDAGPFDIIVSNPPYIRAAELEDLQPEVRDHDPRMALDGGEDGLVFYRRIAAGAPAYLADNGRLYVEMGAEQGPDVEALFAAAGFSEIRTVRDLAGLDRVVCGVKR
ncbi:MAG: peptide chain release factor N(5)-glutamine methyltransferase [Lachnospiraceae bacterium]|nr:peptide chain release factor N(5)-glutamine methyltransferase [Lachnospiraceae bacterium]